MISDHWRRFCASAFMFFSGLSLDLDINQFKNEQNLEASDKFRYKLY